MSDIKVGDKVPLTQFKKLGNGGVETVESTDLFNHNKVLLVGVIGAFTPICSTKHLPDFIPFSQELKKTGVVDETVCVSVADPFVLEAWQATIDPEQSMLMLTDTNAEFVKKMGLAIDLSHLGLGTRSTRYVMLVENGVVNMLNIELEPSKVEKTSNQEISKYFSN